MTVSSDTFIADMLAQVGLDVVVPVSTRRYPEVDWAALPPALVDLILFSSEPYRFRERDAGAFAEAHGLASRRCMTLEERLA